MYLRRLYFVVNTYAHTCVFQCTRVYGADSNLWPLNKQSIEYERKSSYITFIYGLWQYKSNMCLQ